MNALNLALMLTFCIVVVLSQATSKAQAIKSSKLNQTQSQMEEGCSYMVTIRTDCSSPFYAIGEIDLFFGDAYGNQVYVPHLYGPFDDCSKHTYEIYAPCTLQICHVHLYWIGDAAWILDTLTIHNYLYIPVTFYYNTYIPIGGPYGFDYCQNH